jgi:organic hydroperoxide reductase OsmC/OhrA
MIRKNGWPNPLNGEKEYRQMKVDQASALSIGIEWFRQDSELRPGKYSNAHTVSYNPANRLLADAAPGWGGDPERTNPEQALAAALSSCHMMTFLALAAKANWPVASFKDRAVAYLGKNARGQMSVARIDLHPVVRFDDGFEVDDTDLEKMHTRAHRYCFIANTLSDSVEVNVKQLQCVDECS